MDFNSRLNFYLGKRFSQGDFKVSKKQLINIKEITNDCYQRADDIHHPIYKFPLINLLNKLDTNTNIYWRKKT